MSTEPSQQEAPPQPQQQEPLKQDLDQSAQVFPSSSPQTQTQVKKTKKELVKELDSLGKSASEIAKEVYGEDTQKTRNNVYALLSQIRENQTQPSQSSPSSNTDSKRSAGPTTPNSSPSTVALPTGPNSASQTQRVPLQQIPKDRVKFKVDTAQQFDEGKDLAQGYKKLAKEELGAEFTGKETTEGEAVDLEELAELGSAPSDTLATKIFKEPLTDKEKQKINKATKRIIEKRIGWISPYGDIANWAIHSIKPLLMRLFKVKPTK